MSRQIVLCLIFSIAFKILHKTSVRKPSMQILLPIEKKLTTWNPQADSSVQHRETLLMYVSRCIITTKSMSWNDCTSFKNGVFFSFFFPPLLSQAAYSQGLVVSVWWCNAVTVLLHSSRKASATVFRATLTSYKDTYTTRRQQCGHRYLSGPLRGDQLKGGERKCHVLVMKYRTVLNASAGTDPKLTDLTACECRIPLGVCEERVSKCMCDGSYIWMRRLCALI